MVCNQKQTDNLECDDSLGDDWRKDSDCPTKKNHKTQEA